MLFRTPKSQKGTGSATLLVLQHIWRPWDENNPVGDWPGTYLTSRIRLHFDLVNKSGKKNQTNLIQILAVLRRVRIQLGLRIRFRIRKAGSGTKKVRLTKQKKKNEEFQELDVLSGRLKDSPSGGKFFKL